MNFDNETLNYRTRFEAFPYSARQSAFPQIVDLIWRWLLKKENRRLHKGSASLVPELEQVGGYQAFLDGGIAIPVGYRGGQLTCGRVVSLCVDSHEARDGSISWALEYDEPDGALWWRRWHTRVGLYAKDDTCLVNVNNGSYVLPTFVGDVAVPPSSVPQFVRDVLKLDDFQFCVGETPLLTDECYLTAEDFDSTFRDNLLSDQRELPLVLLTTDENGATPVSDATQLALDVAGLANVYVLDWRDEALVRMMHELFRRGEPSWHYGCSASVVRVYRPGIDLTDGRAWRDHRFFTADYIARRYGNGTPGDAGDSSFAQVLFRSLARSIQGDERDVCDLGDVERRRSRDRALELHAKMEQLSRRMSESALVASPKADVPEGLSEEVDGLRKDLLEWQALAGDYAAANDRLSEENERLKEGYRGLEDELSARRYLLDAANERADAAEAAQRSCAGRVESLDTYERAPRSLCELLVLLERLWGDRVVVLSEARDSAGDFEGGDLAEEWEILRSVPTVLWGLYFGDEPAGDVERAYQEATGYELACTESKATRDDGRLMRLRELAYRGQVLDLSPHIKGRNKNPKRAFRLHYCPLRQQDGRNVIVIGHCGAHLETAGTAKIH